MRTRTSQGTHTDTLFPAQSSDLQESPHLKDLGAYYTPVDVVRSLAGWASAGLAEPRVLDPSCGDGRFLEGFSKAVGVDVDPQAVSVARSRLGSTSVIAGDFFEWAAEAAERFDAAIGNPPFIRYQRFRGEPRERALKYCRNQGVDLPALSSSWAPFIVGAASLLLPGGRLAFVVPAEIGHAVYARPLIRWLLASFARVEVIAVREKLFPDLSEDCWLLRAGGFGNSTEMLHFVRLASFDPDESVWVEEAISVAELAEWGFRLRPLLLSAEVRDTYQRLAASLDVKRLGDLAQLGIGYVTGANDFFHLRPSEATSLRIDPSVLRVAVRANRDLADLVDVTQEVVNDWVSKDRPVLLLDLSETEALSPEIEAYLESSGGIQARKAYKCRTRSPWYVVPDVRPPDAFLSLMSGVSARLVANSAGAVCTNSLHAVRFGNGTDVAACVRSWQKPLTTLSCEIEGHALGGGLLKLEPGEARQVLLAPGLQLTAERIRVLEDSIRELREWRHGKEA